DFPRWGSCLGPSRHGFRELLSLVWGCDGISEVGRRRGGDSLVWLRDTAQPLCESVEFESEPGLFHAELGLLAVRRTAQIPAVCLFQFAHELVETCEVLRLRARPHGRPLASFGQK